MINFSETEMVTSIYQKVPDLDRRFRCHDRYMVIVESSEYGERRWDRFSILGSMPTPVQACLVTEFPRVSWKASRVD